MKRPLILLLFWLALLLVALPLLTAVGAAAVPKNQVSADAKWLLHFDIAQFRSTRVGDFVVREILQRQFSKPLAEMKHNLRLEIDEDRILQQISSITIYGTGYQSPENNAVLLVQTDAALEQSVVGALAGLVLAGTNSPIEVRQSQIGDVALYSIQHEACIAVLPGKALALGRTRAITEKAARVLAGKAPNLTSSRAFAEFGDVRRSFFFFAVADAFGDDTDLPPQATVLRMADGGRIVLGESADQLFLNIALRAKDPQTVTQMQQVIQGVVALGSLARPEDKDLAQLVQSIKVSAAGKIVSLNVEYPVEGALQRLGELGDKVSRKVNAPGKAGQGKTEVKPDSTKEAKPEAEAK